MSITCIHSTHSLDFPCILSNNDILLLDPHMVIDNTGGRLIGLDEFIKEDQVASHLQSFYNYFGYKGSPQFKGTIFRFPLRTGLYETKLPNNVYSVMRVENSLFKPFKREIENCLLFMKSVNKISVSVKKSSAIELLYSAEIDIAHRKRLALHRNDIFRYIYNKDYLNSSRVFLSLFSTSLTDGRRENRVWFVINILGMGASEKLKSCFMNQLESYLPWFALAVPLPSDQHTLSAVSEYCWCFDYIGLNSLFEFSDNFPLISLPSEMDKFVGNLFCFLPIAASSHFPFHIHGYFSLSTNRRSIKWPRFDELSDEANWNRELAQGLGTVCYAVLIHLMVSKFRCEGGTAFHYGLWAYLHHSNEEDQLESVLHRGALELLKDTNLVWNRTDSAWIQLKTGYYLPSLLKRPALQHESVCQSLLLTLKQPLVVMPAELADVVYLYQFLEHRIESRVVTSKLIRYILSSFKGNESLIVFLKNQNNVNSLLEIVLSDLDFSSIDFASCLNGIQLIPVCNSEVPMVFGAVDRYFMSERQEDFLKLLPGLNDSFVKQDLPAHISHTLLLLSRTNKVNIDDITNLCGYPDYFVELLKYSMQAFSNLVSPVKWRPGSGNCHPEKSWIELVWKFIDQNQGLIDALEKRNFPILPQQSLSSQIELLPIRRTYMPYIEKSNILGYSSIEALLVECGCYVCHRHVFILPYSRFVKPPIPQGFFQILSDTHVQHAFLKQLYSADDSIKSSVINLILSFEFTAFGNQMNLTKSFPIFRSISNQWVALNSSTQYQLPPDLVPKDFTRYPQSFLSPFDVMNTKLCSKLGIPQISLSQTIQFHLLPLITNRYLINYPQQRNILSIWILRNVSNLDSQLITILSTANWLLDSNTNNKQIGNFTLFSPCNLYDSKDEYFEQLLMPNMQGIFPNEIYTRQISNLCKLGLISSQSLSYKNLQNIISITLYNVTLIQQQNYTSWLHSLVSLVSLHMKRFNLKQDFSFWTIFQNSQFILPSPRTACPSYPRSLPYNTAMRYSKPQNLLYCSEKESCLIAGVMPVLIENSKQKDSHKNIFQLMGVSTCIHINLVCQQLALVTGQQQEQYNHNEIHSLVKKIYKYFARALESGTDFSQIILPQNFVFIPEYGFFDSRHVVLSCEDKFFPYVFSLAKYYPTFEEHFSLFFKKCGIQNEMDTTKCQFILQQLRTVQLVPQDVSLAIKVIELIGDSIGDEISQNTNLLVLAQDRIIYPAVECVFNDLPWLQRSQISTQRPVVHKGISNLIANKLGCIPVSLELAPTAESISYSFMSGSGQREDLVDRLKGILEGYRMHTDVFNELIQNSDDAGATTVKVLFDYTSFPCNSVLHKNMEAIHGPALYLFNNAKFTPIDFESILQLSCANKLSETEKIGRFGIGFNAVYNFTDCPNFVSDDSVQIFDPLQKYVGRFSRDSGVRFRFVKDPSAVATYHDQFVVYQDLFGCNILNRENYNYTLFRLPFRVNASKLSNQTFDKDGIAKLQERIVKEISNLILFLQNVNCIEIYERKNNTIAMKRILKVSKTESPTTHFLQIHKEYFQTYKNQIKTNTIPQNIVYSSDILTVDVESKGNKTSQYLIAYASGNEACFDILRKFSFKQLTFLPICGVAIPLSFIEDLPEHLLCKLYTFLPLPIRSPLYANINCYFALSQTRKNLCDSSSSESDILTQWNLALINDALPNALICALEALPKVPPLCDDSSLISNYCSIWPIRENNNLLWEKLPTHFAGRICEKFSSTNLFLCAHSGSWVSFEIVSFLSVCDELFLNKDFINLVYELGFQKEIQFANVPQSFLTTEIFRIFSESEPDKVFALENICSQILFPSLTYLSVQELVFVFNTLIPLCYEDTNPWLFQSLSTTPFIPCGSDGVHFKLRIPSEVVCPNTKLSTLYQPDEMRIPVPELHSCFTLSLSSPTLLSSVLLRMRVMYNSLPRDEIIGRCSLTTKLSFDLATTHAITLIEYLNSETNSELIKSAFLEFKSIQFVPTYHDELVNILHIESPNFVAPEVCYIFSCRHIVSPIFPVASESIHSCSNSLHLKAHPTIHIVLQVLKTLVLKEEAIRKSKVIHQKMLEIYKYFSRQESQIEIIKENLENVPWVWHPSNTQFYALNQVILSTCQSLPENTYLVCFPYMDTISIDSSLKDFLLKVGVKECIDDETILACIHKIKECEELPLTEQLVELILILIGSLKDPENCSETLFVLSHTNMLSRSTELYIKLPYMDLELHDPSLFLHSRIINEIAFKLGVKSPEELYSSEYDINEEDFGTVEEITDRIQSLVREMPVHSLIKELVQNAEDAGATEVVFILDEQDYSSHIDTLSLPHTKHPNWRSLHTFHSLSVFNNKGFSSEDIKGIQKLSIGGKSGNQNTIGKFGLGFNSVYHLTDVPSFVTHRPGEEKITFGCFDPFLKYTCDTFKTKHSKQKRGKKFDIPLQNLLKFKDQLFPFLFDQFRDNPELSCSLKEMWNNGDFTMFRFPLDIGKFSPDPNPQTIKYNKVEARKHISLSEVKEMLIKQISESSEILLFLTYVKTLKFICIDKEKQVTLNCSQSINLIQDLSTPTPTPDWFPNATDIVPQIQVQTKESRTVSCTGDNMISQWVIYLYNNVRIEDYVRIDPTLSKYSRLYEEEKMWGFGGIAVCTSGAKYCLKARSNVFVFLPIGSTQKYPAHIHAPLLIDSARQNVHYKRTDWADAWHTSVIQYILAPLYTLLLVQLRDPMREFKSLEDKRGYFEWFYSLFPPKGSSESFLADLSEKIYTFLYTKNPPILLAHNLDISDCIIWYTLHGDNHGVFLPDSFFSHPSSPKEGKDFNYEVDVPYLHSKAGHTQLREEEREKEIEIRKSLVVIQFHLTFAPRIIKKRFSNELTQLSQSLLLTYICKNPNSLFHENAIHHLSSSLLSFEQLQTVLEYILTAEEEVFNSCYIPIRVDIQNNLGVFQLNTDCFKSTYSALLPLCINNFISTAYNSGIVRKLSELKFVRELDDEYLAKHLSVPEFINPDLSCCLFWEFATVFVLDLKGFQDHLLVPVSSGDKENPVILYQIRQLEYVVSLKLEKTDPILYQILVKLKCPHLYLDNITPHLNTQLSDVLSYLDRFAISQIRSPDVIISSISLSKDMTVDLSITEVNKLLLIIGQVEVQSLSSDKIRIISFLKIFATQSGEYSSLSECNCCFINKENLQLGLLLLRKLFLNCRLLVFNPINGELIDSLCTELTKRLYTLEQFLEDLVFSFLPEIPIEEQKNIILFIAQLRRYSTYDYMINKLAKIAFIRSNDGRMLTVNQFYSPEVDFFTKFLSHNTLPKEWRDRTFEYLIEKLGLMKAISLRDIHTVVLMFSRREFPLSDLPRLFEAFVPILDQLNQPSQIISDIAMVKFLPVWSIQCITSNHQVTDNTVLVRFCNGQLEKYKNCCCTTSWIHKYSFNFPNSSYQYLGIIDHPDTQMMLNHLIKVTTQIMQAYPSLTDVPNCFVKYFNQSYKYLEKYNSEIANCDGLMHLPCILCETKLYYTIELLFNSSEILHPFVIQLPASLAGKYPIFLERIGIEERATYKHYQFVLLKIFQYLQSQNIELSDSNYSQKTDKVFNSFISALRELQNNSTQFSLDLTQTYLLTKDSKLVLCSDVIFADNLSLLSRVNKLNIIINILKPLEPDENKSCVPPNCLQLKKLTQQITESLDPNVLTNNVINQGTYNSRDLQKTLTCPFIFRTMRRLYFHLTKKDLEELVLLNGETAFINAGLQHTGFQSVTALLNLLRVVPVRQIDTVITDKRQTPHANYSLNDSCSCYINTSNNQFLLSDNPNNQKCIHKDIAYAINAHLGGIFTDVLSSFELCFMLQPAGILDKFNEYNITLDPWPIQLPQAPMPTYSGTYSHTTSSVTTSYSSGTHFSSVGTSYYPAYTAPRPRPRPRGIPIGEPDLPAARLWLMIAQCDLLAAEKLIASCVDNRNVFPAHACFLCFEAVTKVITALLHFKGSKNRLEMERNLRVLIDYIPFLIPSRPELYTNIEELTIPLMNYDIETRIPNSTITHGVGSYIPQQIFTVDQAIEAGRNATRILQLLCGECPDMGEVLLNQDDPLYRSRASAHPPLITAVLNCKLFTNIFPITDIISYN